LGRALASLVVNVGPLDFAGNGGTLPHPLARSPKADAKDSFVAEPVGKSTDSSDGRKR
jgi:hypothetical protein